MKALGSSHRIAGTSHWLCRRRVALWLAFASNRALLVLGCLGATLGVVPGAASAAALPLKVSSSLDGKSVLPRHLRWLARPSISSDDIEKVEFLIDGKLRWVEQQAPYVYSDDDGAHLGRLVTTWLTPGLHRFTVRAVSDRGTATDTVTARVLPAPGIPSALAGTWKRSVPGPIVADPGASSKNPAPGGTYVMTFDRRFVREVNPGTFTPVDDDAQLCNGCVELEEFAAGPKTLQLWGAVTVDPLVADDPVGGWWCFPDGPPTRYAWSVSGDTLTLNPIGGQDPCHQRGTVWAGTWTRA